MEKTKSQMVEEQIDALVEYGKKLREKEKIFLKVSGMTESIEQYKGEVTRLETSLEIKKEDLAELKAEKTEAVKDTLISIQDKITELLPEGDGIAHIKDDGSFIIGWMLPGKPLVPYEGLSGGQKILFGRALSNALMGDAKNKVIIYEIAEVDEDNSIALLKQIQKKAEKDTQFILNTWHKPKTIPEGWHLIEPGKTS